jgi:hypothetical protein
LGEQIEQVLSCLDMFSHVASAWVPPSAQQFVAALLLRISSLSGLSLSVSGLVSGVDAKGANPPVELFLFCVFGRFNHCILLAGIIL